MLRFLGAAKFLLLQGIGLEVGLVVVDGLIKLYMQNGQL